MRRSETAATTHFFVLERLAGDRPRKDECSAFVPIADTSVNFDYTFRGSTGAHEGKRPWHIRC